MSLPAIRVSSDARRLETIDNKPFFWLADTAWQLTHFLNREEVEHYLQTRAAQRFNVIQVVALAEYGGLDDPNAYGHFALKNDDPTQPQDDYFEHIDWAIRRAAELGIYVALLPAWGDKYNPITKRPKSRAIFTPASARQYGQWLGQRYKDVSSIVWVMGGDRNLDTDEHRQIVRAMAEGIRSANGLSQLMTFHPPGESSSSKWVQDEAWLDFHMIQSGHTGREPANWLMIKNDLSRHPHRPVLDAEPCYEDHPRMQSNWAEFDGFFNAYDVRQAAWRAVFAGACGHTYGCHDIWQFFDPVKRPALNFASTPWREALHLPGATQMQHVRTLAESRPQWVGQRWTSLYLLSPESGGSFYRHRPMNVTLFDPRTGATTPLGQSTGGKEFHAVIPPTGPDWIILLNELV